MANTNMISFQSYDGENIVSKNLWSTGFKKPSESDSSVLAISPISNENDVVYSVTRKFSTGV